MDNGQKEGRGCVRLCEYGEEKRKNMVAASLVVKKKRTKIGDEKSVPFIPILG